MKKENIIALICIFFSSVVFSTALSAEVPKEVKSLVGVYKGAWSMFGPNEGGEIVKKMSWTDTIKASNPVVKDGKAYVTIIDTMNFEGGIPAQKMSGTEGYFLNKDGSLGDYFFELNGKISRMKKLEDNIWVYTIPSDQMEMRMLGFSNIVTSKHVMIKVVTWENGVETHRVSRVSTVIWKDKKGHKQRKQYISLQGMHKRQK